MKSVYFFFQAEDGIRDYKVTGVQTCALPISISLAQNFASMGEKVLLIEGDIRRRVFREYFDIKIGRASCRERV